MMNDTPIIYRVRAPKTLCGTVRLPASKSISNRALVMGALAVRDRSEADGAARALPPDALPQNLSDCDDTTVMLRALGECPSVIDIGAAGTAMRFLTAYLAVTPGTHILTGTDRMKHRPIGILVAALRQLGAHVDYLGAEGFPPLRIEGLPLEGGAVEMSGEVSSQYISAMLMIGPVMKRGLELRLKGNIVSRPYIDLTLCTMREYGAEADWTGGDTVLVKPVPYRCRRYAIENDWSAASYWYEMLALSSDPDAELLLPGLTDGSRQGDAAVRYIFSMLGVKTLFQKSGGVLLRKSNRVAPRLDYNFVNSPDLVQTVVVTCAAMGVPFHFRGLESLKIKETDRIEALKRELLKAGYDVREENGSDLVWDGRRSPIQDEPFDTYDDHRMALSLAPLSLVRPEGVSLRNPHVVTKSYPHFWTELQRAGFEIDESSSRAR